MGKKDKPPTEAELAAEAEEIRLENEKRWDRNLALLDEGHVVAKLGYETITPSPDETLGVSSIVEDMSNRDYVPQYLKEARAEAALLGVSNADITKALYHAIVEIPDAADRLAKVRSILGISGPVPSSKHNISPEVRKELIEARESLVEDVIEFMVEDAQFVLHLTTAQAAARRLFGALVSAEDTMKVYGWVYGEPDYDEGDEE